MKFKYGDIVRVKSGFYEGLKGYLRAVRQNTCQNEYYIDSICGVSFEETEDNLELVKEDINES